MFSFFFNYLNFFKFNGGQNLFVDQIRGAQKSLNICKFQAIFFDFLL